MGLFDFFKKKETPANTPPQAGQGMSDAMPPSQPDQDLGGVSTDFSQPVAPTPTDQMGSMPPSTPPAADSTSQPVDSMPPQTVPGVNDNPAQPTMGMGDTTPKTDDMTGAMPAEPTQAPDETKDQFGGGQ